MSFGKFAAVALVVLGLLATACKYDDPGNPKTGGKPKHVAVLGDGSTLGKSNYGLWKARSAADENCRWSVTMNGKVAARGGKHDMVISATALKGGVLHSDCGVFRK
jgi:hypothetical protein